MKNIINFYYGMNVMNIYEYKNNIYFLYNDIKYCFVKYDRNKRELKGLINICNKLKERNILTNEFVCNKFNSFITPYNNEDYILIKNNVKDYKINLNNILHLQNNTINICSDINLIRDNYVELWKNKVDFYEKQLSSISNKYQLIKKTLDYYIGLGENAIVYLTNNYINNNYVVLSHRRITEERDSFDFYNPLNYIFSNRSRDIADYIKTSFFYDDISFDTILTFLHYTNLNREDYILLIARLLYPTYYFDLIDRVLFQNEEEEVLKKIIDKNEEYINLLKSIFYYINYNLKMNIPILDWIIKI